MTVTGITGSLRMRNIKMLLSGYLADAIELMSHEKVPGDDSVHDFRVLMKKSKAVMGLLSGQVKEVCFVRNMEAFGESGRLLSDLRDLSVHRKTLRVLRKGNRALFVKLSGHSRLQEILRKQDGDIGSPPEVKERADRIVLLLRQAGFRLRFEPLSDLDTEMILAELGKTYADVKTLYLKARNFPKPANIHRFRKRAKDFLYQLYVFRSPQQPRVKYLEREIDALTQNLGRYRDHNQIIKFLDYKYSAAADDPALNELVLQIRNREDVFLMKAWSAAYSVFRPGQSLRGLLGKRF